MTGVPCAYKISSTRHDSTQKEDVCNWLLRTLRPLVKFLFSPRQLPSFFVTTASVFATSFKSGTVSQAYAAFGCAAAENPGMGMTPGEGELNSGHGVSCTGGERGHRLPAQRSSGPSRTRTNTGWGLEFTAARPLGRESCRNRTGQTRTRLIAGLSARVRPVERAKVGPGCPLDLSQKTQR